jgi:hypothetical protein
LTQIGASLAVYLRKHGGDLDATVHRAEQRRRLVRHMVAGAILPSDVGRIVWTFDNGWLEGMTREFGADSQWACPPKFRAIAPRLDGPTQVLVGRPRDMRDLPARATALVQAGQLGRTSMLEPQAVTDPYAAKLATVYDKEIEVAARDACHRDYLAFGFGDWRPR